MTEKKFLRNEDCDKCHSKSAVGVWEQEGKLQKYCFKCTEMIVNEIGRNRVEKSEQEKLHMAPPTWAHIDNIPWRSILKDTCVKYGVTRHGPSVYFPSIWDGKTTGFKCRDFLFPKGNKSCHMQTFGVYTDHFFGWQSVHTKNHIAIALGEFDAMAVYQATGMPCLSPPAGDGSLMRCIKNDFTRLDQFEKIVFLPDRDGTGTAKQPSAYVQEAVAFLGEDRCYVANLTLDDPNAYIMQGQTSLLKQAFYAAEPKALELFHKKPSSLIAPSSNGLLTGTPLDKSLQGLRTQEVTYVLGAPGTGKTTLVQNLSFNLMQTGIKVGVLVLEGAHSKFVTKMAHIMSGGDYFNAPPHMAEVVNDMINTQLYIANLTGRSASVDEVRKTVRAAVKAADCRVVVIDNLTGAADPEKLFQSSSALVLALDDLALSLDVHIIVVSHVGRSGYSEPPTLGAGLGTGHVERFGYNIVGVHLKDKLTRVEVLKNREFGPTPHDVFYGRLEHLRYEFFFKGEETYGLAQSERDGTLSIQSFLNSYRVEHSAATN